VNDELKELCEYDKWDEYRKTVAIKDVRDLLDLEPRELCKFLMWDRYYGSSIQDAIKNDEFDDEFCEDVAYRAKNELVQLVGGKVITK
jgi:hypothetical protein